MASVRSDLPYRWFHRLAAILGKAASQGQFVVEFEKIKTEVLDNLESSGKSDTVFDKSKLLKSNVELNVKRFEGSINSVILMKLVLFLMIII